MPEKMTENGQKVENVHNGDGATSHNTHDTSSSQDAPSTNMARIKELMSTHGMNFEDAKEIAEMEASTNTVEKQEAAPVVAQPAPTEAPSPAVIEEEAIDDTFTIKLEQRHVEWVHNMSFFEGKERRMKDGEYTAEMFIVQIIREAYSKDPTKGGTQSQGHAGKFNPKTGEYEK